MTSTQTSRSKRLVCVRSGNRYRRLPFERAIWGVALQNYHFTSKCAMRKVIRKGKRFPQLRAHA